MSKNEYFENKVCVITGAGSGIGRALAVELAERGARLALSDIDADGLAETTRRCELRGAEVEADLLNVVEREAVLRYADDVQKHFGTVHQIYNNAGITHHGDVIRSEFEAFERVMDVDFWGVLNGTKAFLPMIIESGAGHIINVSSLFGLLAIPGQSAYNAAKFAVRGFTESLRQEMLVSGHPVAVTCVHPGGIKTAVARNATYAEGVDVASAVATFDTKLALHTPEMAAKTILDGVRKGHGRVLVGWEAKLLDLFVRVTASAYQRITVVVARSRRP
ncbi:SDR family NAD(P)-dependent oxidoreductase [Nocardia sp. 004]|uniref:SDR family NAD(P)-dependent oxidoreductase n=1 Tax=Nocardia sp. 004 TaxID=3385978 RepID=UPI0039A27F7C